MIQQTLNHIEQQIGLKLELCDYFTGIRTKVDDTKYFNAILKQRIGIFNQDYNKLLRFADKYKTIEVEPNGVNRIAITPLKKNLINYTNEYL